MGTDKQINTPIKVLDKSERPIPVGWACSVWRHFTWRGQVMSDERLRRAVAPGLLRRDRRVAAGFGDLLRAALPLVRGDCRRGSVGRVPFHGESPLVVDVCGAVRPKVQ